MKTIYTHIHTHTRHSIAALSLSIFCLALVPSGAGAATVVNLGTAGNYTLLSKAGISTTGTTSIVGDIGVSPIDSTAITGFGLTMDSSGTFSTSSLVTGQVFAADYTAPTPSMMSTAISDMETAYTDAAGRSGPDFLNLSSGNLNGETLAAGLYKWGSAVTITDSITFDAGGDSSAIWVLQVDNRLNLANSANITLSGGAQAQNIFWQTAEGATLGTNSHFEGILITATDIDAQTGASMNAMLYAQTGITLDANTITAVPEPSSFALLTGGMVALLIGARRRLTVRS